MKNFKLMTLCLLGLSVYGLQAGAEIEYTAMPSMAARKAMFNKQQPANNIAQIRSIDVNTPVNNVQAQRNLVTTRVDANAQKNTIIPKNLTVQQRTFSLAKPSVDQSVNQNQDLVVSSRQSLTLQPQEVVVGDPEKDLQQNKDQDDLGKNVNDGIVGLAKENVVENQQDNQLLIEKPQVEQPIALEAVAQNQDVVVENPNAARIQELQAKGKNKTMVEAAELRRLTTQQTEVVTEISAIKQPGKIDTQAVDAQAMDAKTVESINNVIEKFNKSDIDAQVQSARDVYDEQYPNKKFGYKNTTAYKNGLKVAEAQAKDQALSDVKNEFATNVDGSPRSNREILNALNAKYKPQSPAKSLVGGTKASGSNLTMQQEMRVKSIIKEAKLQGETITQDKAIAQMRSEEEAKENQKPEIKVVEKAETPEEAQAKATAQAKAEAAAKLEAENNVLNEQIYQNDKASIDAQIKIQVDAAIKSDPKIRQYQIKDQIKDQIISSKRESLSSDQKDQLLQQVADAKAAAKAEADQKAADAKAAAKAQAEAEQEEADKRAAATAAQAPVQEVASVEAPKMSLADQLAAAKAKKAAKAAAQAAQQAAQ